MRRTATASERYLIIGTKDAYVLYGNNSFLDKFETLRR